MLNQIEQGAAVDIFISAANTQMDTLEQEGKLVANTRTVIAKNRLVLALPTSSTNPIDDFAELTDPSIASIGIGSPSTVPAGAYGVEVLTNLGIYNQVSSKLVYYSNVRNVLTAIENGSVTTGIVYTTDAKVSSSVKIAATADQSLHSTIVYPEAVLSSSAHTTAAQAFTQYLSSDS